MLIPNICVRKYDDAQLLSLLANDNAAAFQVIYEKYNNRIFSIAVRYLKSETVAQEVVQDVFMKLWSERCNIKDGTPIEAWLCTVAKNNNINRLKKMANEWKAISHLQATQKNYEDSAQNKLKDAECKRILQVALNLLSENQLKVYRMVREEKLSYTNVAEQLKISPLTVKTHMARALGHLKLFFIGYCNAC